MLLADDAVTGTAVFVGLVSALALTAEGSKLLSDGGPER